MIITLSHPDISQSPVTYIAQPEGVEAGENSTEVKNSSSFSVNDYLLVGKYGQDQSEIIRITSIVDETLITHTPYSFPHEDDTPLTLIRYNQFKVYRSTTGSSGTYSLVATKNLMVDEPFNSYNDPNAQANYYYKFTYYNSTTGVESDYSAPIPATGFGFETVKYIQDRVLYMFGDPQENKIKREYITDWLNEFTEKLQLKISGGYTGRWVNSVDIAVNNATSIDLSSYNMLQIFLVEFSTDGTTFDKILAPIDFRESFDNVDLYNHPVYRFFKIVNETLILDSAEPLTGTIRIWYFSAPTRLSQQTDSIPSPFTYSSEVYVNYAVARAYEKDRKFDEANHFRKLVDEYIADILPIIKSKLRMGKYYMTTGFMNQFR